MPRDLVRRYPKNTGKLLGGAEHYLEFCEPRDVANYQNPKAVPTPENQRERALRLIKVFGPREAGKRLGVSRNTAIAVAAGMNIHAGTLALLERSEHPTPPEAA